MKPMPVPKLPDDREILSRVESPVRPHVPVATNEPVYRVVFYRSIFNGRAK